MPVYNGEKWLEQAIESLVEQDYPNKEILLIDDCSSDSSWDICKKYASKHECIKIEKNDKNLGGIGNYEKVLRKAQGDYFVWTSQDDYWEKYFVSKLVSKLQADPEAVIAMGRTVCHTSDDEYVGEVSLVEPSYSGFEGYFKQALRLMHPVKDGVLLKNNLFLHGVINASKLKNADKSFPGMMVVDRHYLLQLALSGKWLFVDEILYHRRVHENISRRANDPITTSQATWYFPLTGIFKMLYSVVVAQIVPLHRKLYALPIVIVYLISQIPFMINRIMANLLPNNIYRYARELYRTVKTYYFKIHARGDKL